MSPLFLCIIRTKYILSLTVGDSPHVLPKLLGAGALFSDDTLSLHLFTATEASKHSQVSHEHKLTQVVKLFKSLIE